MQIMKRQERYRFKKYKFKAPPGWWWGMVVETTITISVEYSVKCTLIHNFTDPVNGFNYPKGVYS